MDMGPKVYGTTTMTEKGQIVIPAEAREELGLIPGSRLLILGSPNGAVIVVKAEVVEKSLRSMLAHLEGGQE